MQQYYDLEMNVLSCIIQNPSLMEETILDEKYFIKHKRLWVFMKSFYEKYKCFDMILMYNVCSDKWQMVKYIEMLYYVEPTPSQFKKYEHELIHNYSKKTLEKTIIQKIYQLSTDLYVGNIELSYFYNELDKMKRGVKMEDIETFTCQNCGETYTMEEHGTSELALQDDICIYCMDDGYGQ